MARLNTLRLIGNSHEMESSVTCDDFRTLLEEKFYLVTPTTLTLTKSQQNLIENVLKIINADLKNLLEYVIFI